jgi:signal peptidase I
MQCSNCQFQNMPGVTACGRCGASLQMASLAIDVFPPRASRLKKWWRRWFPIARYWNRLRFANSLQIIRIPGWPAGWQTPGVLFRMVVPGWAQHHVGRTTRGWAIFGCYLAFLLAGLLFFGSGLGYLMLGIAISLHAASILDVVAASVTDFRQRFLYTAAAMLALMCIAYYPAGQLLALVATPQQFAMNMPPFQAGDVVLVNPSAYWRSEPQPGDVVHYRLPDGTMRGVGATGHALMYQLQGDRIDRIIAQAGDELTSRKGELLVNGQPSPWLPLNPLNLPDGFTIKVPENYYLIFPSGDGLPADVLRIASIVPRGQIWGRAYWRNQPLSRFGPIH